MWVSPGGSGGNLTDSMEPNRKTCCRPSGTNQAAQREEVADKVSLLAVHSQVEKLVEMKPTPRVVVRLPAEPTLAEQRMQYLLPHMPPFVIR